MNPLSRIRQLHNLQVSVRHVQSASTRLVLVSSLQEHRLRRAARLVQVHAVHRRPLHSRRPVIARTCLNPRAVHVQGAHDRVPSGTGRIHGRPPRNQVLLVSRQSDIAAAATIKGAVVNNLRVVRDLHPRTRRVKPRPRSVNRRVSDLRSVHRALHLSHVEVTQVHQLKSATVRSIGRPVTGSIRGSQRSRIANLDSVRSRQVQHAHTERRAMITAAIPQVPVRRPVRRLIRRVDRRHQRAARTRARQDYLPQVENRQILARRVDGHLRRRPRIATLRKDRRVVRDVSGRSVASRRPGGLLPPNEPLAGGSHHVSAPPPKIETKHRTTPHRQEWHAQRLQQGTLPQIIPQRLLAAAPKDGRQRRAQTLEHAECPRSGLPGPET